MSIRDLIKEARGSAIWDGVKLLWAAGGAFIATIVHGIVGWATGHPNLTSIVVTAGTGVFLGIVALVVHKQPDGSSGPRRDRTSQDQDIIDRDRVIAELKRNDELLRAENLRLVNDTYTLQAKVSAAETALMVERGHTEARRQASQEIWMLKRFAREIRRRWPNADFIWFPAAKSLWVNPSAAPSGLTESGNNREWVADAINWHEEFKRYRFTIFSDEPYLNALDFDELMEHLDKEERARCGIPDNAVQDRPTVAAEYGKNAKGERGLHVWNLHGSAAFDVRVAPLRLGKCRVFFPERLAILDRDQGKSFLQVAVGAPYGLNADLFDLINKWRAEADCWDAPLLLRIVYRDKNSNWFMTTFMLEQHGWDRDSDYIVCRSRPGTDEQLSCLKA